MPPSKTTPTVPTDAEKAATAAQAAAERVAAEEADAAAQAEAEEAAAAEAAAAAQAAAVKAAAQADKNAARTIGTADEPSKATTEAALKRLGIDVLAEARRGDKLICRVLQDAKRVWKEIFHEA